MANYMSTVRTNYFRVTNENRYQELFNNLCSEDNIHDFSKTKDGVLYHGFGSYGSIDYINADEDYNFAEFLDELQKILPEDEAFMFFESGYEKLRYVTGIAIVVTKNEIVSEEISTWAIKKAKELLGNSFTTEIDY